MYFEANHETRKIDLLPGQKGYQSWYFQVELDQPYGARWYRSIELSVASAAFDLLADGDTSLLEEYINPSIDDPKVFHIAKGAGHITLQVPYSENIMRYEVTKFKDLS